MFIVDDNVIGSPAHAKELFRALIPCDKRWIGQASLNLGRDPELLDLAARSGCIGLFMGFESLSPESLAEAGKTHNCVQRYEEDVKRIPTAASRSTVPSSSASIMTMKTSSTGPSTS